MTQQRQNKPTGLMLLLFLIGAMTLSATATAPDAKGRAIEFQGPILAIDRGTDQVPSALTIKVNSSQVQVQLTSWTRITQGRGFDLTPNDLKLGAFLEVRGFFTAGGKILAQRIQVEGSDALDLEGTIQSITGSSLFVNGIELLLTPESVIRKAGDAAPKSAADLKVGSSVRLRAGIVQGVFVIVEIEYGQKTVESEPIRFEGRLVSQEGQVLTVDVGITGVNALVAIDLSTQLEGALVPGALVEVEGRFVPGTALVKAVRIAVDSNDNGNLYDDGEDDDSSSTSSEAEVEGTISGLVRTSGGSVRYFNINQTRINLNSQTKFFLESGTASSESILENGLEVEVVGTRNSDGSILAVRIEVKGTEDEAGSGDGSSDDGSGENEEDEEEVELEGPITAVTLASGKVVAIVVEGTTVVVNAETQIFWESESQSGQPQLAVGVKVHVKAIRTSNGSVVAKEVAVSSEDQEDN